MIMRVSVGIHKDDIDKVIETYNLMSQRLFTHATPTLFNAGMPKPQMSSCFLLTMKEDSISGIYDTLKQAKNTTRSKIYISSHIYKYNDVLETELFSRKSNFQLTKENDLPC